MIEKLLYALGNVTRFTKGVPDGHNRDMLMSWLGTAIEIAGKLNTQEEKAKQLGVAEPCIVPTASNQSNTEPTIAFVLAMNNRSTEFPRGRGNGYVAVPKSHPLYGKHCDDVSIDIHGDLTYSGYAVDLRQGGIVGDYRVLGFDTAHADDDLHNRPRKKVVEETLRLKTIVDGSGQGIRSEVTDGEATVNFMQYADEPAPDMRDVKTTVAGPPCKACYGKKQHTQLHGYRARGEEYGMKVHMNDCKRCNATGIEPTTESVSRTIDNSKILTKEKAQVHELMKELKEKEVEPTTGSVSTVEQETVGAGLLEGKKRKEEYISKLTTPDPYEECVKDICEHEYTPIGLYDCLKKHFPPLSLT